MFDDMNFTTVAVYLVLIDELIQLVDDVKNDEVDELIENQLNPNSVISVTFQCHAFLHVFLHENS